MQGCGCCYLEVLTGLTLRFHGWLGRVFVYVCLCVCASQQEARAMFRSVEERDTEGLFPRSLLPCSHLHQQDTARQTHRQLCAFGCHKRKVA